MNANDPHLTAYVLGELPETEMRKWQALLDENPELRREAEAIRATVVEIEAAMQSEPLPAKEVGPVPLAEPPAFSRPRTNRRRLWFSVLASVAALFVALLIALPFLPRPIEEIAPKAGVALHDLPLKQVAVAEGEGLRETHADPVVAAGSTELEAVESDISGGGRLSRKNFRESNAENTKIEKTGALERNDADDNPLRGFDGSSSLSSRSSMVDGGGKLEKPGDTGVSDVYSVPTSQIPLGGSADDAISLKLQQERQSSVFLENVARPMVASKEGRAVQEREEISRHSDTLGLPDATAGSRRAAVMSVPSSAKESSSTGHAQPDIIEEKGFAEKLHSEDHDGFLFQSNSGQPFYAGEAEVEKNKEDVPDLSGKTVAGTRIASPGSQTPLQGGRFNGLEERFAAPASVTSGKSTSAAVPGGAPQPVPATFPRQALSASIPPSAPPVSSASPSTFSLNGGANAYDRLRDGIRQGRLPSRDEVHIVEYVNHFRYDNSGRMFVSRFGNTLSRTPGEEVAGQGREHAKPERKKRGDENAAQGPLMVRAEIAPCPWKADHLLALLTVSGSASTERANHESRIVAQDVKIRINCNPELVAACRLVGYENPFSRDGKAENTESQAVESADEPVEVETLRDGDQICILYEITPAPNSKDASSMPAGETPMDLLSVKLRYAENGTTQTTELDEQLVSPAGTGADVSLGVHSGTKFERNDGSASDDFRFAAAVALFGMLLRESPHVGDGNWDTAEKLARDATANRPERKEFLELLREARNLATQTNPPRAETAPTELESDRRKE